MNKVIVALAVVSLLFSFKSSKKEFIPPGTVKIKDSLYADVQEVSIQSWREYSTWAFKTYGNNSAEYLATLPDSTAGFNGEKNHGPDYYYYFKSSNHFKEHPITGISHEQALAFCKWRTQMVKQQLSLKKHAVVADFEYRLPSEHEWELLADDDIVFRSKNYVKPISIKENTQEYKVHYKANLDFKDSMITPGLMPCGFYPKNSYKLQDMIGNVAEMIAVPGVSKGGSWYHGLEQSRPTKAIPYTQAQQWLGFRCVCIVKNTVVKN